MKRGLAIGFVTGLLIMNGCSSKNPSPEVGMGESDSSNRSVTKEIVESETVCCDKVDNVAVLNGGGAVTDNSMEENIPLSDVIANTENKAEIIYFDFDKYDVKSNMMSKIEHNAQLFSNKKTKELKVKIEGNCDEWGTDEYNYALGLKRAKSVKDSLIAEGLDADRFVLVSYGESNPACQGHNQTCWAKNRRAEFKLLP